MDTDKANNHQYHCCFCRHFQLAGYRWGYCDLLNVYLRGDGDACQVSVPPFSDLSEAKAPRDRDIKQTKNNYRKRL